MTQVLLPTFTRPIVDANGALTEESRVFFSELVNRLPSYGSGSPENVVAADVGATYYDLNAAAGSRVYLKVTQDVSGDRTQGWELA